MQLSFIAFALLMAVGRFTASPVLSGLTDNSVIYNPEDEPKQDTFASRGPIFPARERPNVQKVVYQGSLGDESEQFQQDDEEMSTDLDKTPVRRVTGPYSRKKEMQNNFSAQQSDLSKVRAPFQSSEDTLDEDLIEEDDFLMNDDEQQQDLKQGGMRNTQMYDASGTMKPYSSGPYNTQVDDDDEEQVDLDAIGTLSQFVTGGKNSNPIYNKKKGSDALYGAQGSTYNPKPQQSMNFMTESQDDQSSEGMESLIQYSNDGQQVTIGAVYFDYLTRLMELATLYKEKHNENFWDTLDPNLFGTEEDEVEEEKGSSGYPKQMYTAMGDAARGVKSAVVETRDQMDSESLMTSGEQGDQSKGTRDGTRKKLTIVGHSQGSGMGEEDEEDEEDNVYTNVDDKKFEDDQDLGDDLGGVSLFG